FRSRDAVAATDGPLQPAIAVVQGNGNPIHLGLDPELLLPACLYPLPRLICGVDLVQPGLGNGMRLSASSRAVFAHSGGMAPLPALQAQPRLIVDIVADQGLAPFVIGLVPLPDLIGEAGHFRVGACFGFGAAGAGHPSSQAQRDEDPWAHAAASLLEVSGHCGQPGQSGQVAETGIVAQVAAGEGGCELDRGGGGPARGGSCGGLSSSWCSTCPGRVRPPGCSANPKRSPIWFWEGRAPARPGSCRGGCHRAGARRSQGARRSRGERPGGVAHLRYACGLGQAVAGCRPASSRSMALSTMPYRGTNSMMQTTTLVA